MRQVLTRRIQRIVRKWKKNRSAGRKEYGKVIRGELRKWEAGNGRLVSLEWRGRLENGRKGVRKTRLKKSKKSLSLGSSKLKWRWPHTRWRVEGNRKRVAWKNVVWSRNGMWSIRCTL